MTQALILTLLAIVAVGYWAWMWHRFWPNEVLTVGKEYWLSRGQLPHWPRWPKGRRYNPLYDFPWFLAMFLGVSVIWSEPGEGPGASHRVVTTAAFVTLFCLGVDLTRRWHNHSLTVQPKTNE